MAIIIPKDFSKRRPKLTLEDFDGMDASALTMAEVEIVKVDDGDGKRTSMVVTFSETGDKAYWPNASSIAIIVEQYGPDSEQWIGKPLPLMRHEGTFNGKAYENIQVPAAEMWSEVIRGAGLVPVAKPRSASYGGGSKTKVGKVAKRAKGRGR